MSWWELATELGPSLRKGDLTWCLERVSDALKSFPESPFHMVLDLKFTNDPYDVVHFFDKFINKGDNRRRLKAIYTETNGFDINPDRWFFELHGFDHYKGHEDYDWLASPYISSVDQGMTLLGMEELQRVYADHDSDEFDHLSDLRDHCSLMVVLHFQTLIKESASLMNGLDVPILATGHDYDFIYEFRLAGV